MVRVVRLGSLVVLDLCGHLGDQVQVEVVTSGGSGTVRVRVGWFSWRAQGLRAAAGAARAARTVVVVFIFVVLFLDEELRRIRYVSESNGRS
jgi:hypothetical protein